MPPIPSWKSGLLDKTNLRNLSLSNRVTLTTGITGSLFLIRLITTGEDLHLAPASQTFVEKIFSLCGLMTAMQADHRRNHTCKTFLGRYTEKPNQLDKPIRSHTVIYWARV